jgi:fibronectin type 3 domain-containing protein
MDAYNKLYDFTVGAVKRVHSNLQVGGPVVAGSYIEPFLEHLKEKNYLTGQKGTQVDFLSFHSYGSVFEKVVNKIDEIHRTAGKIKKEHQKLPYIVSEFSPSPYDPPWYVNQYPALWLIATVDAVFNYTDQNQRPDFLPRMMIYWTAPVIKEFGENTIEKKTDGLATTLGNNIFKLPVFNAFEMLGYLSNERVMVNNSVFFPDYKENLSNEFINLINAIATRSDSSFEVLVYQFTENDAFSQNKKGYHVKLIIENIPNQKYYLRRFAINELDGNTYQAWKKLNCPSAPNQYQLEILEKADDLNLKIPAHEPEIAAGTYTEELILQTNEAILLLFAKQVDEIAPLQPSKIITSKVGKNSVRLEWQTPKAASDGDMTSGYEVYQDQKLVARTFQNIFSSEYLGDNTTYQYQIYSLDEQGNKSVEPLNFTIRTKTDNNPPKLVAVNIQNLNAVDIKFDEPLDERIASEIHNYQLTNGVTIESVSLDKDRKTVQLKTSPHQVGKQYTLTIGALRDRAQQLNEIKNYHIAYQFLLKYEDKFDFDNLNSYIWKHIWEEGGIGSYKYDATDKRLKVTTGDDVGESFSHYLAESDQGIFQIDFQPIQNYPTGGRFILRLKQSDDTYYQVEKTHGYGAGYIKKVIRGFTVDSTSCRNEFQQGSKYKVDVRFAPHEMMLVGFNEIIKIDKNNAPINLIEFEIQLLQQDAYFDNIYYESR